MFHRKFRLLVALLAALTLFLGACGDDDDNASTDEGTTEEDSGSSDGADGADGEAEDAEGESEAEDAAEDAIGDLSGDCAFLGEFATTGFDEAFSEADPFSDGGEGFQVLAEEFQEVADNAPGEIEEDFQLLAEAMQEMADALADVDFSDPESFDPSAFEQFDQAQFEEAGQRIEAWLEENCPGVTGG